MNGSEHSQMIHDWTKKFSWVRSIIPFDCQHHSTSGFDAKWLMKQEK